MLFRSVPSAAEMDRRLHEERIVRGTHRRRFHPASWSQLPSGVFVRTGEGPALVLADSIVGWTVEGYASARARPPAGTVEVITPPATLAALAAGYRPQVDPSASP